MLAESVHSLADTSNQGLLLLGGKRAKRAATAEHPSATGATATSTRHLALLLSPSARVRDLRGHPQAAGARAVELPLVAVAILLVAVGLESYSFRTAIHESRPLKGGGTWWSFIRQAKVPELPVVLLEDFGALIGLVLALLGVGLSVLTGDPVFDALGTIAIGLLLGVIAVILIIEMKSLLLGEGATGPVLARIVDGLTSGAVERVLHIRTQYIGPEELLVAAKIALTSGLPVEGRRPRDRRGGGTRPSSGPGGKNDLPGTRPGQSKVAG